MGKSLNGKELGRGITQRKDGLYMARFTDRYGKKQALYDSNYNAIRRKLRDAQYEDERALYVVKSSMTLDEWFDKWLEDFKSHCRSSSKRTYGIHYDRVREELGWRKLGLINMTIVQEAINKIPTEDARMNTRKILKDMFEKAMDSRLIQDNPAEKVSIKTRDRSVKKEPRVLTIHEQELFTEYSEGTFYRNVFLLALETGLRIGELCGLMWSDIDFEKKLLYVNHTMVYFSRGEDGYVYELHDTKTYSGQRKIPLTTNAVKILHEQQIQKEKILSKHKEPTPGFEDLVFVTRNNKPTNQFLTTQCIKAIVHRIQRDGNEFEMFSPHALRHTFATRALENGVNMKTLQKLMGHKHEQITSDIYCHVTDDTLFEDMLKMEA